MITTISWSNYCIAIGVLVLVWYLFLGFRFYYQELTQFVSGKHRIKFPRIRNTNRKHFDSVKNNPINSGSKLSSSFSESLSVLEDVEELSRLLVNAVTESALGHLSKNEFSNYLRVLINDYPFVKESALRARVNELIVSECQKHPELIFTYSEADDLWNQDVC